MITEVTLSWAMYKYIFWKSVHARVWNESLQVSEKVGFAQFDWKYYKLLNIKTGEWDLRILLFTYWNELGAYVCLKGATAGVWECRFCWIWLKISQFFNYKQGKVLFLNYWNGLPFQTKVCTDFMKICF